MLADLSYQEDDLYGELKLFWYYCLCMCMQGEGLVDQASDDHMKSS